MRHQNEGSTGNWGGLRPDFISKVADPRVMSLIILPTEKCNFRCRYCYEDFAIGRMRPEIVAAVKAWIAERAPELQRLDISWFGGEPTLSLPIIYDINALAREALARSTYPHARFKSGITTNAYRLDWETFCRLVAVGVVDYQITLDGPKDIHDRRRLRSDGSGTFDRIWGNLKTIAERSTELSIDFRIELRLHYDRASASQLEPLVEDICTELIPSGRFLVKFHEIEPLGGPFDSELDRPTEREHEIVRALSRRIEKALGAHVAHVARDVQDYICYAAKANSFVVRADGRIGKCTVALKDPRNDVGRLNADGTITWYEGRLDPWLRGIPTQDSDILACPLGGMAGYVEPELRRTK